MNQVTNMKLLSFKWKRIANLLGFFPEVVLCIIDFRGFFHDAFDPHIYLIVRFVIDHISKLVFFLSVAEADDSPVPPLRSSLLSPLLSTLCTRQSNSLHNFCIRDGCWFSFISPFAMFIKSINDCPISFEAFSLFIIQE